MTTTTKWTPGPWKISEYLQVSENHAGYAISQKGNKWVFATVMPGDEDGKLGGVQARETLRILDRAEREREQGGGDS